MRNEEAEAEAKRTEDRRGAVELVPMSRWGGEGRGTLDVGKDVRRRRGERWIYVDDEGDAGEARV